MTDGNSLRVQYATVSDLLRRIIYAVEGISVEFERWEEEFVRGPSLYFVLVTGVDTGEYADPLGENRWPVETCRVVDDDLEEFVTAARSVAFERDGAVVVAADGTVQEQMVRIKSPQIGGSREDNDVEYADWMGTKHLSAAEASTRDEVIATVTLSEEDGRVTVFEDGKYDDYEYAELGGKWRVADSTGETPVGPPESGRPVPNDGA